MNEIELLHHQSDRSEREIGDPRVIQIVRQLSRFGGVEHVAYELHQAWIQAGIDTRVVTSSCSDVDLSRIDFVAPWIGKIKTRSAWRYLAILLASPLFTVAVTPSAKKYSNDSIVVSHGESFAGDICVMHSVHMASIRAKRLSCSYRWIFNPIHVWMECRERIMIKGLRHRRYVAISSVIADELKEYYGVPDDRIFLIPNGVNLTRFRPNAFEKVRVRSELGIPPTVKLLIFVGHEFERKGLAYAIRALSQLRDDVYLLVVGTGKQATYRKIVYDFGLDRRVIFLGGRNDLPSLYAAADALIFPTYYEAAPLVCMEAMASGLPLFSTRVGGVGDYLKEGRNGYFIDRNVESIVQQLQPVLSADHVIKTLSDGARATAEEYSWPRIAERYLELIEEVYRERCFETAGHLV